MAYGLDNGAWDEIVETLLDYLVEVAVDGSVLTTGELTEWLDAHLSVHDGAAEARLPHLLRAVSLRLIYWRPEAPLLWALAYEEDTGLPDDAFFALAEELGRDVGDRATFWESEVRRLHTWASGLASSPRHGMPAPSVGQRLCEGPRVPATGLDDTEVPSMPGVYCWWLGADPFYIAATEDLRDQLERERTGPQTPVPPFRQKVRALLQRLSRLAPGQPRRERARAIDGFIAEEFSVSWRTTDSLDEAEHLAQAAREELLDETEEWRPRPGEDRWLRRYLADLPGRVYVEVPIGRASGGATRRIDAVRLCGLEGGVRNYTPAAFHRDLALADPNAVEIIEVKRKLNRAVVGQLLVARDLAAQEWRLAPSRKVSLLALVTVGDRAIEGFCQRNGIRVEVVQRLPEDAQPEDDEL